MPDSESSASEDDLHPQVYNLSTAERNFDFRGRLIKLILFNSVPIALYSYLVHRCYNGWIYENYHLGLWLLVSLIIYITIATQSHIDLIFDMLDRTDSKCAFILRKVSGVFSMIFYVLTPIVFLFGVCWNFYG